MEVGPAYFMITVHFISHLDWQSFAFAAESVEAHIFARTNKPEWWPDGWDWSAKALETARREEMDSFFIVMRDCQAAAEVQTSSS